MTNWQWNAYFQAATTISKSALNSSNKKTTLPADFQYPPSNLSQLSLKPTNTVRAWILIFLSALLCTRWHFGCGKSKTSLEECCTKKSSGLVCFVHLIFLTSAQCRRKEEIIRRAGWGHRRVWLQQRQWYSQLLSWSWGTLNTTVTCNRLAWRRSV